MKNPYTPELSYNFAWTYVQVINQTRSHQHPPFTLAEMFNIIGSYLRKRSGMMHSKIGFSEYCFVQSCQTLPLEAAEPRPGLIEFRLVTFNGLTRVVFPGDLNSGWQSPEFKAHLVKNTLFHGYVVERSKAFKLRETLIAAELKQSRVDSQSARA
jgi:hypothetical protein